MYKTYKINLTQEEEDYLNQRRTRRGITLQHQFTEAVKAYINECKKKEGGQGAKL